MGLPSNIETMTPQQKILYHRSQLAINTYGIQNAKMLKADDDAQKAEEKSKDKQRLADQKKTDKAHKAAEKAADDAAKKRKTADNMKLAVKKKLPVEEQLESAEGFEDIEETITACEAKRSEQPHAIVEPERII